MLLTAHGDKGNRILTPFNFSELSIVLKQLIIYEDLDSKV